MAIKILDSQATVSEIFYPNGKFMLQLTGLNSSTTNWFLQCLPRELPDSSGEWTEVMATPFADSAGRRSITFDGSEGFKYRVANTHGSPTNNSVEAYWYDARTVIFR